MKKLIMSLAVAAAACVACAEYKVINLVNGTNDVQVNGAVIPVAIEVKSTKNNATVAVDRQVTVDKYIRSYDITTNEIPWQEAVVTTNDYFMLSSKGMKKLATRESAYFQDLIVNGDMLVSTSSEAFWTNRYLKGEEGSFSVPTGSGRYIPVQGCYGNGAYVIVQGNYTISWSTNLNVYAWQKATIEGLEGFGEGLDGCGGCVFANGRFIATLNERGYQTSDHYLAYSSNGYRWTVLPNPLGYTGKLAYENGRYFSYGGIYLGVSNDGTNWVKKTIGTTVNTISYGNGKYLAGCSGYVQTSTDGYNWVENTNSLSGVTQSVYVDGLGAFMVVKSGGVYTTKDGVNFSPYAGIGGSGHRLANAFNGYVYVAATFGSSSSDYKIILFGDGTGQEKLAHFSGTEAQRNEVWKNAESGDTLTSYESFGERSWRLTKDEIQEDVQGEIGSVRPSKLTFDLPGAAYNSYADLVYSRVTNYIPHIRYEYVTNRTYNTVVGRVTKTQRLATVQCADGYGRGVASNDVYVINTDKIIVDSGETISTDSTSVNLIVK